VEDESLKSIVVVDSPILYLRCPGVVYRSYNSEQKKKIEQRLNIQLFKNSILKATRHWV
jgi:hypothetical protein